jgi:hypothetical protein
MPHVRFPSTTDIGLGVGGYVRFRPKRHPEQSRALPYTGRLGWRGLLRHLRPMIGKSEGLVGDQQLCRREGHGLRLGASPYGSKLRDQPIS